MVANSSIIKKILPVLNPLIFIFGLYIIINGTTSPGGGFQGGAVLAGTLIIQYLVFGVTRANVNYIQFLEKILFLVIIALTIIFVFYGNPYAKPIVNLTYIKIVNFLIGLKVYSGLSIILLIFIFNKE